MCALPGETPQWVNSLSCKSEDVSSDSPQHTGKPAVAMSASASPALVEQNWRRSQVSLEDEEPASLCVCVAVRRGYLKPGGSQGTDTRSCPHTRTRVRTHTHARTHTRTRTQQDVCSCPPEAHNLLEIRQEAATQCVTKHTAGYVHKEEGSMASSSSSLLILPLLLLLFFESQRPVLETKVNWCVFLRSQAEGK